MCLPFIFLGGNMSSRRQRERLRAERIAFDMKIEEGRKNALLKEEKPKTTTTSTTKRKASTTKKKASQKAKE